MSKLKAIVDILDSNKQWFENYYMLTTYKLYDVQKDCLATNNYESGLRLLDICFASRQGGQTEKPLRHYEEKVGLNTVEQVFKTLKENGPAEERVTEALRLLSEIEGIGSKIASVYLKFLIVYANSEKVRELGAALTVPLDRHLQKFLFSEVKVDGWIKPNRFNIFLERVNGANLSLGFDNNGNPKGRFFEIQNKFRRLFEDDEIHQPIIILDNLWVVGHLFCNNVRISKRIACDKCMFGNVVDENGNVVCGKQEQL